MTALAQALLPGQAGPVLLGEYPYYRADPVHWPANLAELRAAGVDVVTCYLPWRLHEYTDGDEIGFDFTGRRDPQLDVTRLLTLIQATGLRAIIKPGPFIHAEVQLGGLPDRLCGQRVPGPAIGLNGNPVSSQGVSLPSLHDPRLRAEVERWLAEVRTQLLEPFGRGNGGPVIGVQLGNEGCYGEIHLPLDRQDASPKALAAFARWLGKGAGPIEQIRQQPELAEAWARWCGLDIQQHWRWLADQLPPDLVRVVNVPFAAPGDPAALAGWLARQPALRAAGALLGHTEWIGNAARQPAVLAAHCFQQLLNGTDVVEANWGFTWTDPSHADPATPLFHSLLTLLLGSTTCSVYTACSTRNWGAAIDLDPAGLRGEGIDPALYQPPYCPGAPLTEDGPAGPTRPALDILAELVHRHGSRLPAADLVVHGVVELDPAVLYRDTAGPLAAQLHAALAEELFENSAVIVPVLAMPGRVQPAGAHPSVSIHPGNSDRAAELVRALPLDTGRSRWQPVTGRPALLVRRDSDGYEFAGVFNPHAEAVTVRSRMPEPVTVTVPAHAAVLVISHRGTPVEVVAALPADAAPGSLRVAGRSHPIEAGCRIQSLAVVPA